MGRLEHVNLTVADPDASAGALGAVFGWAERWRGPSMMGGWTIHLGEADGRGGHYVALYTPGKGVARHGKGRPLNHVGVVVDDLDACEARAAAAGFEPFNHDDYEPGRRFYFFDSDGIEWEVASYA